jgi:hypothetical protein
VGPKTKEQWKRAFYDSVYIAALDGHLLEIQIYHYKANDITDTTLRKDPKEFFIVFYSTWTVMDKNCFR